MQVKNGLSGICALVDDHAVSPGEAELLRNHLRRVKQIFVISLIRKLREARNLLARNDQNMHRSLRLDIPKGHHVVVLIHNVSRNLALDDLGEQGRHASQFGSICCLL